MLDEPPSFNSNFGHPIIPSDIGLPGSSSSLLTIYCEENFPALRPGAKKSENKRIIARDMEGRSVLHLAALKCAPLPFVEELLEMGADVNLVDYSGSTPLHLACEARAHEHTILLVARAGADISMRNGAGQLADLGFIQSELPPEKAELYKALLERETALLHHSEDSSATKRHQLYDRDVALLCAEQKTLFGGDSKLLKAAARVAKFEVSVPLGPTCRGTSSSSLAGGGKQAALKRRRSENSKPQFSLGDDESDDEDEEKEIMFRPKKEAIAAAAADDDDDDNGDTTIWPEPPENGAGCCWFNVLKQRIPLNAAASFLVGGMCFFDKAFHFNSCHFHVSESVLLPEQGIEITRLTSTTMSSSHNDQRSAARRNAAGISLSPSPPSSRRKQSNSKSNHHISPSIFRGAFQRRKTEAHIALDALAPPAPPVVIELLSAAQDTSLPTVLRVFRDVSGSVAALAAKKQRAAEQQRGGKDDDDKAAEDGLEEEQKKVDETLRRTQRARLEDDEEANSLLLVGKTRSFRAKSLQAQAEARATVVILRSLEQLHFQTKFRSAMLLTLRNVLTVKTFLQKSVMKPIKFLIGVMFFVTASFLRYAFEELGRFPGVNVSDKDGEIPHSHGRRNFTASCLYAALRATVSKLLFLIEQEKFVSSSLLHRAVTLALRRRQQRHFELARVIRRRQERQPSTATATAAAAPAAAAAAASEDSAAAGVASAWRLLPKRERNVWSMAIDEVLSTLFDLVDADLLVPVISVAQIREGAGGFLPCKLMYDLKCTSPGKRKSNSDNSGSFESYAREKAKRTLCDMTVCFKKRKNYLEYVLKSAKEINAALNASEELNMRARLATNAGKLEAINGQRPVTATTGANSAAMQATAGYSLTRQHNAAEVLPDRSDPALLAHILAESPFRRHMTPPRRAETNNGGGGDDL